MIPEDIRDLAADVLAHRLTVSGTGSAERTGEYFRRLLAEIPVPMEGQA